VGFCYFKDLESDGVNDAKRWDVDNSEANPGVPEVRSIRKSEFFPVAMMKRFYFVSVLMLCVFLNETRVNAATYDRPETFGNSTRGATHFAHKQMTPWWARGRDPVVTIGNHTFYRLARL